MKLLIITQKVDRNDDLLGFFHTWLEKLAARVDEIFVITLRRGTVHLPSNVQVFSLGKDHGDGKWLWMARFYRYSLGILPLVDGVFCHMSPDYVLALAPLNFVFRKPLILWYAHIKVGRRGAWACRIADRVLSPSRDSFSLATDRLIETGHGIDTERFQPAPARPRAEKLQMLLVNRISPVKQLDILVDAVNLLVTRHGYQDFHVRTVGSPARPEDVSYFAALREKARRYGVESYLEWLGSVPHGEIARFYQEADVFLRLQVGGGHSKNELEALSCGLPVILSEPVYVKVFGRFTGSLVFREKDPEGLAERILAVAQWSSAERAEFARLARGYVKQYHDLETMVARIVDEFRRLGACG